MSRLAASRPFRLADTNPGGSREHAACISGQRTAFLSHDSKDSTLTRACDRVFSVTGMIPEIVDVPPRMLSFEVSRVQIPVDGKG